MVADAVFADDLTAIFNNEWMDMDTEVYLGREEGVPIEKSDLNDVEKRFTLHSINAEQKKACDRLRYMAMDMARLMVELCPDGMERSSAISSLDMAVMWANAAIARS